MTIDGVSTRRALPLTSCGCPMGVLLYCRAMLERLILLALLQTPDVTAADQLFNAGRFAEAEVYY